MRQIFVSVDIEADGPIPGANSMLSLGAAVFLAETGANLISKFNINLRPLPQAEQDETTMKFWRENSEAWKACTIDQIDPVEAITRFKDWLVDIESTYHGRVVFVGYPAGYDFMFVHWYMMYFLGAQGSMFDYSALDIKTYAMAVLKVPYYQATKKHMPKAWKTKNKSHTHLAVDDAIEQGKIFMRMYMQHHYE